MASKKGGLGPDATTTPSKLKAKDVDRVKLFGLDLTSMPKNAQLGVLALGAIGCAVAFSALQEQTFRVPSAKAIGGYVALFQTLTYAACGMLEMFATGDRMKGSFADYTLLCCLTQGGMLFTNWALQTLSYETRVIFKSSKVIPVMIMGVFINGRSYSWGQYGTACLLAAGIAFFTLGDKSPDFNLIGIVYITVAVVCDAITGNFEEKRFFHTKHCSQAEVVTYSSVFGAVLGVAVLGSSGELRAGISTASEHPSIYWLTVMSAVMGYASVAFVLALIKHFSATVAEVVKSCRKVLTLIISFALYAKPINRGHIVGFSLFVASIVAGAYLKSLKKKPAKKRKDSNADTQ